jgi:intergrase/recombinase
MPIRLLASGECRGNHAVGRLVRSGQHDAGDFVDSQVESANHVVRLIADSYLSPNKTLRELHQMVDSDSIDSLRAFSEACRAELQRFKGVKWVLYAWIPASKHSFSGSRSSRYTKKKATADYADMTHYKARDWHAFLIAPIAIKSIQKEISRSVKCHSSIA